MTEKSQSTPPPPRVSMLNEVASPKPRPEPTGFFDWLLGKRLASDDEAHEQIGPLAGIPILGLDALSSAAYGPEAALTLLLPLGALGLAYVGPVSALVIGLLFVVYFSYRQTIHAYPGGGGNYTVAKENLGTWTALLAGAALAIDYILNVAVGISAGVGALVSAIPSLLPHRLAACMVILLLLTIINLRGIRESGRAFMAPTYAFVITLLIVIVIGGAKAFASGGHPGPVYAPPAIPAQAAPLTVWLLVRSFASGCTAMTGVEAVSNGVPIFRKPTVRNAQLTLTAIIVLLAALPRRHRVSLPHLRHRRDRSRVQGLPEHPLDARRSRVRARRLLLRDARLRRRGPRAVREHELRGLPTPLSHSRRGPLSARLVRDPRAKARVLARDHHARRALGGAPRRLSGHHRPAHSALRHRRLPRLHDVASRHGSALAARGRGGGASLAAHQRHRGGGHRRDARRRRRLEVHRGRLDHGRDRAAPRLLLRRREQALRGRRRADQRRQAARPHEHGQPGRRRRRAVVEQAHRARPRVRPASLDARLRRAGALGDGQDARAHERMGSPRAGPGGERRGSRPLSSSSSRRGTASSSSRSSISSSICATRTRRGTSSSSSPTSS